MTEQGHLKVYDLCLRTKSPLFIGNGKSYTKLEYLFDPDTFDVSVVDQHKLFQLLIDRDFVDLYEAFMLSRGFNKSLSRFLLNDLRLSRKDIARIVRYTISGKYALDENHSLKELYSFHRDESGKAYIPGSSLKGAFRTVLLQQMILKDEKRSPYLQRGSIPEGRYLHTLRCKLDRESNTPKDDPVNSIMRGISISDSEYIPDSKFTISTKIDTGYHGGENDINLCRECVVPGTEIHFRITLDQSVLHESITIDTLRNAIAEYGHYYRQTYVSSFERPLDDSGETYKNCIVLGGGAGFFSKTLVYPYLGKEKGFAYVTETLDRKFPARARAKEHDAGISPRKLKYTEYQKKLYPFGVCEVIFA